jgi:peptidoglycan/LPS O-acetylase OafA/YrhL
MAMDRAELPRVTQLDAIRGFALCMVLTIHSFHVQPLSFGTKVLERMLPTMWISVDLFFVLSGYLITGILLRTRNQPGYFRRFYIRRVLRILPAYYLILAAIFFVLPHVDAFIRAFVDLAHRDGFGWMYWLHVQNLLFAVKQPDLPWPGTYHFWSLAVEEQYYLLWPFVVLAAPPPVFRRICVALFFLCLGAKLVEVALHGDWILIYMGTPTRIDGLAAGSLVACLSRDEATRWARPATIAAFIAGAALLVIQALTRDPHNARATAAITTLAAFAFGVALLRVHARVPPITGRLLQSRVLVWLGVHSYGIYLLHLPILMMVTKLAMDHRDWLPRLPVNAVNLVLGTASLAITLPIAWLMFRAVEKPMMDLRFRLAPDPAPATPLASAKSETG